MSQKRISLLIKEIAALEKELESLNPTSTLFQKLKQGIRYGLSRDSKVHKGKSNPKRQKIIDAIKRKEQQLDKLQDKMPQPKKGDPDFP
jgi:hypothetical protein|tara:strand:- start:360 stop:626 length:267 start_codon:yes stop_codon:yes gene_type:complete